MAWYECPDCGEEFTANLTYGDINYCPNCGSSNIGNSEDESIDIDEEEY